jgi:hypothetical protein
MKEPRSVIMWEDGSLPYYLLYDEHLATINDVFRYMRDMVRLRLVGKERTFYVPPGIYGTEWKLV